MVVVREGEEGMMEEVRMWKLDKMIDVQDQTRDSVGPEGDSRT